MREVHFDSVSFSYPKERSGTAVRRVFDCLSIRLSPGKVYAMSGPNGSGKSTFARLMAGIICPDEGRVMIGGKNIRGESLPDVGRAVGYVMQDPSRQLITGNPVEEVSFGLRNWGMPKAAAVAMAEAALRDFELSHTRQTHVQRLSKGEKVRLALAAVSVLNPDWLILDESLASLDAASRSIVIGKLEAFRRTGRGVLVITHSPILADEMRGVKITVEKGGNMLVG